MSASSSQTICVFACKNCAMLGVERAAYEGLPLPSGIHLQSVPCAGSVSSDAVIQALLNGADGVAVLGCHLGGCRHNEANRDAHARLSVLGCLLEEVGIDRRRVLISWGTAHEAVQYAATMRAFASTVKKLIPLPERVPCRVDTCEETDAVPSGLHEEQTAEEADPKAYLNDMRLRRQAVELISRGVDVLALARTDDGPLPMVFTRDTDVMAMTATPKIHVAKEALRVFRERYGHGSRLAVACRACDARAMYAQISLGQLPVEAITFIPISCSDSLATICECENREWPDGNTAWKPCRAKPSAASLQERRELWMKAFGNCVQCRKCGDACPVCVCPTCALQEKTSVSVFTYPLSPLEFHLAQAMHVADVCVRCGACEDACPEGLPLHVLHDVTGEAITRLALDAGVSSSPLQGMRKAVESTGMARPEWYVSQNVETVLK